MVTPYLPVRISSQLLSNSDLGGVAGWQVYSHKSSASPAKITVVDDAGRTVTVPSIPNRIVVLEPSAMDIVVRLGLRSSVVGVDCGATDIGGVSADCSCSLN